MGEIDLRTECWVPFYRVGDRPFENTGMAFTVEGEASLFADAVREAGADEVVIRHLRGGLIDVIQAIAEAEAGDV